MEPVGASLGGVPKQAAGVTLFGGQALEQVALEVQYPYAHRFT